jgi:hypothetical protein
MPLRSSARSASFHTKYASNENVVRVVDANSFLAHWSGSGLAISAVEPITAGVNEFWIGDRGITLQIRRYTHYNPDNRKAIPYITLLVKIRQQDNKYMCIVTN